MVTLSLFDTILSLHCEDVMLELLLGYLLPCQHVPISQRYKINQVPPYAWAANNFLDLAPEVMKFANYTMGLENGATSGGGDDNLTLDLSSSSTSSPQHLLHHQQPQPPMSISRTIGANWNHYGLHTSDSLYANYQAYLFDAKSKIGQCKVACQQAWSSMYAYQRQKSAADRRRTAANRQTVELMRSFLEEFDVEDESSGSITKDRSKADDNSINSMGEGSSGYESFKNRLDDEDMDTGGNAAVQLQELKRCGEVWKVSNNKCSGDSLNVYDLDLAEDLFTQGTVNLGEKSGCLQWN